VVAIEDKHKVIPVSRHQRLDLILLSMPTPRMGH